MPQLADVAQRLEAIGQGHLLTFRDRLDEASIVRLLEQIESIDLERVPEWVDQYVLNKPPVHMPKTIEPPPTYPASGKGWDRAQAMATGAKLIGAGKVAAFTVAGGQGSRLGFDGPKGCYPAGCVTRKPLFACLADWIIAAERRFCPAGVSIPWYVMTSPANHDATREFFEANDYFGLSAADVMFFSQGMMPSFDMTTGKILLAGHGEIAMNPDGHGGSLKALVESGAIADMRERGVEHISYTQVDNALTRVIDPVFIGLHAGAEDSSGEMSSKMVAKAGPSEKVGVLVKGDGKVQVIEYSDLPEDLANETNPDGSLRLNAGSIAIHVLGVSFVERLNEGGRFGLPFHRAEKKVPHVDLGSGQAVSPSAPNGVKLETFVFDALQMCERSIVMETERVEEFAPIKNAEGNDSPATCARIQTERAAGWLEGAGVSVPRNEAGDADCTIELAPTTAMWGEDLAGADVPKSIERSTQVSL